MIKIAKIRPEQGAEAVRLILSLFEQHIFCDYTDEGKSAVRGYVTASSLVADDVDNFALVAIIDGSLVGIAKVKRKNHLSMLFVSGHCQGRGTGRRLLEAAMCECKVRNPDVTGMTANGSRFALPFFLKQGFQADGGEVDVNGVRFTPMKFSFLDDEPKDTGI